jgi:uncharacterized protein YndB with AHSA1/START domain
VVADAEAPAELADAQGRRAPGKYHDYTIQYLDEDLTTALAIGETMKLHRTVVTDKPLARVFDYLSDFTTTTDWDPGTVSTVRLAGDGGTGTSYLNTSRFLGRTTELRYVVQELVPGQRIRLRAENETVTATDTMAFRAAGPGTEVRYTAEFGFKGAARFLAPLLRPALERLGDRAEAGLRDALARL